MSDAYFWLTLVLVLVIVELSTGTIYILMLALGALAGALAAKLGLGMTGQQSVAALCAVLACGLLWLWRKKFTPSEQATERPAKIKDRNLSIDIGQIVQVSAWQADGSTQVHYRGSLWLARLERDALAEQGQPGLGAHTIVALSGNELRLRPVP